MGTSQKQVYQPVAQVYQPVAQVYPTVSSEDIDLMMGISFGENDFSKEAFFHTYCSMMNRLTSGYGNGVPNAMLRAYYAPYKPYYNREWSTWTLANLSNCPVGTKYVLSYDDINYLTDNGYKNLTISDADYVIGNVPTCNKYVVDRRANAQCLYVYRTWGIK